MPIGIRPCARPNHVETTMANPTRIKPDREHAGRRVKFTAPAESSERRAAGADQQHADRDRREERAPTRSTRTRGGRRGRPLRGLRPRARGRRDGGNGRAPAEKSVARWRRSASPVGVGCVGRLRGGPATSVHRESSVGAGGGSGRRGGAGRRRRHRCCAGRGSPSPPPMRSTAHTSAADVTHRAQRHDLPDHDDRADHEEHDAEDVAGARCADAVELR